MTPEPMVEDAAPEVPEQRRVKLWDLPVRLVHWSFVLLIPALWWTHLTGQMPLHRTLGYCTLGLVLFRLYWGVFGSAPARFTSFIRGPRAMFDYLRGRGGAVLGHNPLGAMSVIALLLTLIAQVSLGLFAQDVDGLESGPLSYLVSYEASDLARELHEIGFYILLGLIALHLIAILFYLTVKRDNLVAPMVTGHKRVGAETEAPRMAPAWRALTGLAISAAIAWWVSLGCPVPGLTG